MRRSLIPLFLCVLAFTLPNSSASGAESSPATSAAPSPLISPLAAGADSFAPFWSGNGRFLFFQSLANDLVPQDGSLLTLDLFRYELQSEQLVRVSAEPVISGFPADWISPSSSADGDVVVFASLSTAIVPGKTDSRVMDIFWKRISTGEMGLVSVSTNGTSGGNADSRQPVISSDGRYVAFESDATDLAELDSVSGPPGTTRSVVYLHDLQTRTRVAASIPAGSVDAASSAYAPTLSNDGQYLAFYTKSLNPSSAATRIAVWNVMTREIIWSYTMSRFTGNNCRGPQFSPDGRVVAFFSRETNARMRLAVHDLQSGEDFGLTNDFLLCAPLVWSASSDRVYLETFFQIGSWDFRGGEEHWQALRNPTSTPSSASWAGLAVSGDSSVVVYRNSVALPGGAANVRVPSLFARRWPDGETNRITLSPQGNPSVQEELGTPLLTEDGRWIAWEASDSTLVAGDFNRAKDVFLHDRSTGTTRLISRHAVDPAPRTGTGSLVGKPALAGSNRLLAFASGDGNYAVGDTNLSLDLFVQNLATLETHHVTLGQTGFAKPFQRYLHPQLSVSGGVVAFVGFPVNSADGSGFPFPTELHVLDLESKARQTLMPAGNDWGLVGIQVAPKFHLSADGKRVAFEAHSPVYGSDIQIFLRDLASGTNMLVSSNGRRQPGGGTMPLLTPDGKKVLFVSTGRDLLEQSFSTGLRRLYKRDLESGQVSLLSTNLLFSVDAPVLSPDGRYAALRMGDAPAGTVDELARVIDLSHPPAARLYPGVRQVYGFDRQSRYAVCLMTNASDFPLLGTLCRLDLNTGEKLPFAAGQGKGFWTQVDPYSPPVISADGRYIVFESADDSLVEGDHNNTTDIFLRDNQTGTTILISSDRTHGGSAHGTSSQPVLSADGQAVVFRSRASNLVQGDFNTKSDLFILTFAQPDTDGDGLPDDWEVVYFGTLARDGEGDFDSDGQNDLAEYRAGTDPTGAGSVFRVIRLESSPGTGTEIFWSTVAGKRYRVEYKESVSAAGWVTGLDNYQAASSTGRWTDSAGQGQGQGQRFYRVVLLE